MAWPKKIAQGGEGSNRSGPVPRPPRHRNDRKRVFMQQATVAMLRGLYASGSSYSTTALVMQAEGLFEEIEERCK